MNCSNRSSGRRSLGAARLLAIAVFGLLGLTALPSAPATAQVGKPVQLVPQAAPDNGAPPAAPEAGTTTGQPAAPQGFEITPLEAVGADYAGTLEPDKGGFGIDMWRGTDRVRVERLLPLLKPTVSPILAELTRRLVLSNAASPAGKGSGAGLLPPRVRLLADMGLAEDAVAVLKLLPADQRDAASARLLVELSWRAGDLDGACAVVQESVPRLPADSFWQEATIFCQLHAGQSSEAMLGLDLLREQAAGDEAFFALAEALGGSHDIKVPSLPAVTPLYVAMAHAAGVPPPAVAIREPPPLMLALIAESPDAPADQRLTAAETAAAAGVLSPQHLAAAYAAQPAKPGTLDTALDLPDVGNTSETRAILYQAALHAGLPQQRAKFIQKALATDTLDANYWARLQIYLPLLADIAPAPELAWFAPDAARHLYAGGKLREAGAWVALIQQGQQTDPAIAAASPQLVALDVLARNAPLAYGPNSLAIMPRLPPNDPRTARLHALFDALQEQQPETSSGEPQVALAADAPEPAMPQQNVNLWLDLGEAAAKNRIGETVLLSLVGLNATGLADAEPEWLARAVTSLRRVGLEEESRRLAVEAAIANGL
ncbi:MAG TPA: hypothetical protein VE914_15550 [Candidatus Angelobacter sp.]|nr:hypothetical protein [Candidatus Angelobacter sp.]